MELFCSLNSLQLCNGTHFSKHECINTNFNGTKAFKSTYYLPRCLCCSQKKITNLLKSTDCSIKSHQLQLDIKQFQELVLQNKTADLHAYSSLQRWHLNWLEFASDAHIHAPGIAQRSQIAKLQLKEWLGSVAVHDVFLSPISFLHLLTMHTKAK